MEFFFQNVTAKYGHDFLQVLQEMRENEKKLSQNRLAILPFRYSERSAKQMCLLFLQGEQSICEAFKNVSR